MLTLLRKIRKKLLAESQLRKYLLYAFGEVLLIVIGILIALQISNWNNESKDRKFEINLLKELKNELQFTHSGLQRSAGN